MALYRISFSIPVGVVPLTVNNIQGIRSNWLRKIRYGYQQNASAQDSVPWQRWTLATRAF